MKIWCLCFLFRNLEWLQLESLILYLSVSQLELFLIIKRFQFETLKQKKKGKLKCLKTWKRAFSMKFSIKHLRLFKQGLSVLWVSFQKKTQKKKAKWKSEKRQKLPLSSRYIKNNKTCLWLLGFSFFGTKERKTKAKPIS